MILKKGMPSEKVVKRILVARISVSVRWGIIGFEPEKACDDQEGFKVNPCVTGLRMRPDEALLELLHWLNWPVGPESLVISMSFFLIWENPWIQGVWPPSDIGDRND